MKNRILAMRMREQRAKQAGGWWKNSHERSDADVLRVVYYLLCCQPVPVVAPLTKPSGV